MLPKYKKQWTVEKTTFGWSDTPQEVYLVFDEYNPILHHGEWKTVRLKAWQPNQYPCPDMYFFEIFKYLRKYQLWLQDRARGRELGQSIVKAKIKKHLIEKHIRQLSTQSKLRYISDYSKFIDHVFDNLDIRAKITLVIQKKIGYKYYENITYY